MAHAPGRPTGRGRPPAGQETNWLYTETGQKWFPWFRVYGPEKAIMDKSWRLPDIELMK